MQKEEYGTPGSHPDSGLLQPIPMKGALNCKVTWEGGEDLYGPSCVWLALELPDGWRGQHPAVLEGRGTLNFKDSMLSMV